MKQMRISTRRPTQMSCIRFAGIQLGSVFGTFWFRFGSVRIAWFLGKAYFWELIREKERLSYTFGIFCSNFFKFIFSSQAFKCCTKFLLNDMALVYSHVGEVRTLHWRAIVECIEIRLPCRKWCHGYLYAIICGEE